MINSLSPGFFKLLYTGPTGDHTHLVPVRGSTGSDAPPTASDIATAAGSSLDADVAIAGYAANFAYLLGTNDHIGGWELYAQADEDSEAVLLDLGSLDQDGVGSGVAIPCNQAALSFVGGGGFRGRLIGLDTYLPKDQVRTAFSDPPADGIDALALYLTGDSNIRITRGGTYPLAVRRMVTKENDALRRSFFNI